jgi:hypothetical protein
LARYCIEKAWVADGFPGELDEYTAHRRTECLQHSQQTSTSQAFELQVGKYRTEIEESLGKRNYSEAVQLVKDNTRMDASPSQVKSLLSLINDLVKQKHNKTQSLALRTRMSSEGSIGQMSEPLDSNDEAIYPEVPKRHAVQLSYEEFMSVLIPWWNLPKSASVHTTKKLDTLSSKLLVTIDEFERLRMAKALGGEDVGPLEIILKSLKKQLSHLQSTGYQPFPDHFLAKCKQNIHQAFCFYARSQNLLGTKPDFEEISRNLRTLSVGKFIRFFRDFGLMEKPRDKQQRGLDRKVLTKIFMKYSVFQKEMGEDLFVQALDLAAEAYYSRKFDAVFETNEAQKSLEEKRKQFYRVLELDDFVAVHRKFKGFTSPFGTKTDYRIPEDDPARRYKYKEYHHQRLTVEEFRRKRNASKETIQPRREHAHKAPSDAIVAFQKPTNVKAEAGNKGRNPFTWQGLGDMQPEQLRGPGDNFNIDDLIVDDSSDEEGKQLSFAPRQALK